MGTHPWSRRSSLFHLVRKVSLIRSRMLCFARFDAKFGQVSYHDYSSKGCWIRRKSHSFQLSSTLSIALLIHAPIGIPDNRYTLLLRNSKPILFVLFQRNQLPNQIILASLPILSISPFIPIHSRLRHDRSASLAWWVMHWKENYAKNELPTSAGHGPAGPEDENPKRLMWVLSITTWSISPIGTGFNQTGHTLWNALLPTRPPQR